jgi:hypothetical protein
VCIEVDGLNLRNSENALANSVGDWIVVHVAVICRLSI